MALSLIPQPRKLVYTGGRFKPPARATIAISDESLYPAARLAAPLFHHCDIRAAMSPAPTLTLILKARSRHDSYRLRIAADRIIVEARSPAAVFYAIQTLLQIKAQVPINYWPQLTIDDWSDFEKRGVYYDVARGRVPTTDSLKKQADLLAHYKINELQYYIEHTFKFSAHPTIGRGASPLTPEDILDIDRHCRRRHIELVPSLASFGHLAPVLTLPAYRHLAEDFGVGKYLDPMAATVPPWKRRRGWTLSPANPKTYKFLDSLFAEFLPLFSSNRFNVCCDETWDLGLGQSYALCKRRGKGRVYLNHLLKVRELAAKYGKRIMFWGDIIRQYPDLIGYIPDDVTVLDWGYHHTHDFNAIRDFKQAGLDFYACPGTSSWNSLFPRWPQSMANIHGFAAAGKRNGALGLLNTDWGDGGHYNFMEYSWPGYLFGAEQAWNVGADTRSFAKRFCRLFMGVRTPALRRAFSLLGDVSQLMIGGNGNVWMRILFKAPGDEVFDAARRDAWTAVNGRLANRRVRLDARLARKTIEKLEVVREVFAEYNGNRGVDPTGVLPYWIFAVDTMTVAAMKLEAFGCERKATAAERRALKRRMASLMRRFEKLWLMRNRRSQVTMTLRRYRKAIEAL